MKYTERYRCEECGTLWYVQWDTESYDPDCTQCPNCGSFEFEEVE